MGEDSKICETKTTRTKDDENIKEFRKVFRKESDENINNENQSHVSVNLNDFLVQNKSKSSNNSNIDNFNKDEVALVNELLKKIGIENNELDDYTTFGNVNIASSSQVHVGNITYINGPVNINYTVNKIECTTDIKQEIHISTPNEMLQTIPMVYRDMWLAKPPYEEIVRKNKAAKLIIICHTQTSSSTSRTGNESCVRLIQSYHMESNGWNDIGYNFLIGCDERVYEGCGWRTDGRHSKGYNENSLGIAFIGLFNDTLPSQKVIDVYHGLIAYGVQHGMIDKNYELIGHCQIRPFVSPGKALFKAIQTWPNFTFILKQYKCEIRK